MWSYNETSQEISWSPGMHKLLGTDAVFDQPSFDTHSCEMCIPMIRRKLHKAYELLKQGVFPELKFRVIHPNGQLRWLTCRTEVLYAKDGSYLQSTGIIVDVTDQQTLLELFRRKEKRLDALAAGVQFQYVVGRSDRCVDGVPAVAIFSELLRRRSCSDWSWLDRVPESERAQARATWQQAVADGKHFVSRVNIAFRSSEQPVEDAGLCRAGSEFRGGDRRVGRAGRKACGSDARSPRCATH